MVPCHLDTPDLDMPPIMVIFDGAGDTMPVAVMDLHETDPVRVGDVLIVGRLGEGGMGVVYLGRGPGGNAVAVKVMRADLAGNSDFRQRFAGEVSAMRDVGAAHAAGVLASDVDATQPWMVMEYVQGMTLSERIGRAGALPPEELHPFALGLLRAVAGVHGAAVVHRDLKPSNVVLSPQGVRLLDFGVAQAPGAHRRPGERVGSLTWMAPEQLDGNSVGVECDIHAVGMLLYYAATGRHIYGYGEPKAVAWRISHVEPQLADLPDQARAYGDIILAALAKDPTRRPSLRAMHQRLRVPDRGRSAAVSSHTAVETREHAEESVWDHGLPSVASEVPAAAKPPTADGEADLMSLVHVVHSSGDVDGPSRGSLAWAITALGLMLGAVAWAAGIWPFS